MLNDKSQPSFTGTISGMRVTQEIRNAHSIHVDYPLLPGDMLIKRKGGTYDKIAPGLCVTDFRLTPEQEVTLEPVVDQPFGIGGMDFFLKES